MESFFARYRNIVVLLAILLAQIIGLAIQVRRTSDGRSRLDAGDSSGVRLIRYWAQALVSPPERLIHSSKLGTANLWQNYLDLRNVRQQNQDLQKTIDRLRLATKKGDKEGAVIDGDKILTRTAFGAAFEQLRQVDRMLLPIRQEQERQRMVSEATARLAAKTDTLAAELAEEGVANERFDDRGAWGLGSTHSFSRSKRASGIAWRRGAGEGRTRIGRNLWSRRWGRAGGSP